VWPYGVEVAAPLLDQHLGLPERVEHLAVQQLVPELAVEALHVAVLPRAAGLDVGGLGADAGDPAPHLLGDELGAVVRPDVGWHSAQDEEIG
jgi:hypothetical protein